MAFGAAARMLPSQNGTEEAQSRVKVLLFLGKSALVKKFLTSLPYLTLIAHAQVILRRPPWTREFPTDGTEPFALHRKALKQEKQVAPQPLCSHAGRASAQAGTNLFTPPSTRGQTFRAGERESRFVLGTGEAE